MLGINTMLATSREQAVFAEIADNDDLRAMAARELQEALRANKALFNVLLDSLRPKSEQTFRDADGMLVEPYKRALKVYLANGGCALKTGKSSESRFSLRLGWLEDVTNSGVRIPQPENICKIEPEQKIGDNYRAGVDLPVNNLHFFLGTFANHVSLADCSKFMSLMEREFARSYVRIRISMSKPKISARYWPGSAVCTCRRQPAQYQPAVAISTCREFCESVLARV